MDHEPKSLPFLKPVPKASERTKTQRMYYQLTGRDSVWLNDGSNLGILEKLLEQELRLNENGKKKWNQN